MWTEREHEFWLMLFMHQIVSNFIWARYADMLELRGIEQATINVEFWEIVGAG